MAPVGHKTEQMGFDFGDGKSVSAPAAEVLHVSCLECGKNVEVPAWYT